MFFFLWKHDSFFRILWGIESSQEQHSFEIQIFYDIINVFTLTFDQFNLSLLNKSWISSTSINSMTCIFTRILCTNLSVTLSLTHEIHCRTGLVFPEEVNQFVFHSTLLMLIFSKIKHGMFFLLETSVQITEHTTYYVWANSALWEILSPSGLDCLLIQYITQV